MLVTEERGDMFVMSFYIGVSVVLVFLCGVIYFQHTVEFGQGKGN
jgi:hypothetical protein